MDEKTVNLIKSSAAYDALKRDADRNRLSHAYLLVSSDTVALDMLTDLFLRYVLAKDEDSPIARAVTEHNYGDIIYLPEGDRVTVKDVNSLTETAYITPIAGDVKYYVISRGETMNEPSQNKLLKTLEEPPSCTRIVIKAASTAKLLPTVLSRCRKIELEPFAPDKLRAALSGDSEAVGFAVAGSRGSLTRALNILSDPTYSVLYSLASDLLLKTENSGGAAEYAFKLYDYRDRLTDIIDFAEIILLSGARAGAGCVVDGNAERAKEAARRYSPRAVIKETEVLSRARRRLESNGNVNAIIDELIFSLLEVRAKWK